MTTLNIRLDEKLKINAQKTFKEQGLDLSAAVRMFLIKSVQEKQDKQKKDFFATEQGKALLVKWEKETNEALDTGKRYKNADDMFKDILD